MRTSFSRGCGWWVVWLAGLLVAGPSLWAGWTKAGVGGTINAGNAFYVVHVQDLPGAGVGLYTITTGPSHPAGSGLNVLFGGGSPGTSFNTIRSYTSRTDYIQGTAAKTSINSNVLLDVYGTVTTLGTTGVRTTYVLPGAAGGTNATPDRLTIIQDLNVNGGSFADSTVEVTTTVINNGATSVQIGIRYLWDYQVGQDDGPTFKINAVACPPYTTEIQAVDPTFESYRIEDNDTNPQVPTFDIFGTVNGPATFVPAPTPPDLLQYVCWPTAIGTAFDYAVDPTRLVAIDGSCSSGRGGDSAVLYFFGRNIANAILIPPGAQSTVTASLFLTPPQPPAPPAPCVTRNARFWSTHADSTDLNCVTLKSAIVANCLGGLDLGFITLPTLPRYNNVTDPSEIALIEALGFFYRGAGRTGESGGVQTDHRAGSPLCRARKKLAAELIAATANTVLFGTDPSICTYRTHGIVTNFPADLVDQARAAAAGEDVTAIKAMTTLLKTFNSSGATNDFPAPLNECSPGRRADLRSLSRDPTTQNTCPGINATCQAAKGIVAMPFSDSLNLDLYSDTIASPSCGDGGVNAVWKLSPPVAAPGRHFTVDTFGSNFNTLLSVWSGTCDSLAEITCNDNTPFYTQSQVTFRTDGTNTYYIVGEGLNGMVGKLKLRVTSP